MFTYLAFFFITTLVLGLTAVSLFQLWIMVNERDEFSPMYISETPTCRASLALCTVVHPVIMSQEASSSTTMMLWRFWTDLSCPSIIQVWTGNFRWCPGLT